MNTLRAVTGLAAVALTLVAAHPVAAQAIPAEADQVAIALTDEADTVAAGDDLTYTVSLRNSSSADTDVRLELSLPVGATATSVEDGERAEPWLAVWRPTVPAGGTVEVSAVFEAGEPRPDAKGYTAQACLVRENVRVACATDINQVPGAADINAMGVPAPADDNVAWWTWLVVGAGALFVAAAALFVRRARR